MVWFGADPGGTRNFGVAVLRYDGSYITKCVDCADEAVEQMSERPGGIGIDCPLWWSEHECDAVLAAVAARNGVSRIWRHDLSLQRSESELDPKQMWFGEVNYFWPD
jgi:hypothetical protein